MEARNRYHQDILEGLQGSKQDFTWNEAQNIHICCNSKSWWRHKENCLQVVGKDEELGNEKWKALDKMDKGEYIKKMFEL